MTKTLHVALGDDSYAIVVGTGLLNRVGEHLTPHIKSNKVLIVTDAFVKARYVPVIHQSLVDSELDVNTIEVPAGEKNKSLTQFSRIQDSLVAHQPGPRFNAYRARWRCHRGLRRFCGGGVYARYPLRPDTNDATSTSRCKRWR